MRSFSRKAFLVAALILGMSQNVMAASVTDKSASGDVPAETTRVSVTAQPVQVAMVDGDYHKYEAMTWQNRGYSGGIKDLDINYTSGDDVTIDAGGTGIIGNGDYKGYYSLKNKDVGYVDVDFKQFRKYYDTYGGIYQGFSRSLSRDLYLDIGRFSIEAGITMPDLPAISVYYDHDYKDGAKSTLEWATAYTGPGTTGIQKKISPSWKEINESVDTFGIKGDYTESGYHLIGDQRWEIAKTETVGYQQIMSMSSGISGQQQTRQYLTTDTTLMTTTLGADKWYLNDKVFTSSAYRLVHLKNDQVQKRVTFTDGRLTGITTPNADGQNNQNINSWVMNLMVSPWSWLSGTGSFKAEVNTRDGESYLPSTATSVLKSNTESNTYKFAEAFGLRFKAIPRTVIYSDLSFEQSQNHLLENQIQAIGANPNPMSRDAIINEPVVTWATGLDFQPVRFINLTSQFRLRDKNMDFHEGFMNRPGYELVYIDKLQTKNMGFTQRATAKLSGWAQASFRYLYDVTGYTTRAIYETQDEKARMLSNTFIYDVSVYPTSDLSMTGSFSQQLAETKTKSASMPFATLPMIPTFTSNYYTWMFTTDYQPHKKVHLDGSLFYTFTNNYGNNQSPMLVNYASAYDQLGLTVACQWDINKDLSITPAYGFQRYLPNEKSGIGGAYDAQIVSISLTANWG